MIGKSTLREIKASFGRYLAILAIVALGVSIFAGLKSTKPQMLVSVQNYLEEKHFFDYRLLSTWGFEQEDVEVFSQQEGVFSAEGAYSFDILYEDNTGNEYVLKAHSLTEKVNLLELKAGRMPDTDTECVVDASLFTEEQIGEKIVLGDGNTLEDLENFKYREYTIVGLVDSSYYIQFERGNTSLGNGKIAGFMYLMESGFRSEYYTEIFVKFQDDFELYSEAYKEFLEEKEPVWEQLVEERGDRRFADTLQEARDEIADARKELEEERADAQAELDDAKEQLEEAKAKLVNARKELTEGEQELADAEKEIAEGWKEIAEKEQELVEGEEELLKNEQEVLTMEQEIADGFQEWYHNEYLLKQNLEELSQQESQIEMALAAGLMTPEYAAIAKAQIADGKAQINAAFTELYTALGELNNGKNQLEEVKRQITDAKAEIQDARKQLADAKEELRKAESEIALSKQDIVDGWADYEDGVAEYEDGVAEYEEGLVEFQAEIADAEAEIADAEAKIADLEAPKTFVLGRNTNVGYVCFESDCSIVDGIANIFPVFFFLVAALVCMTTMNRMVEEQRTQIGVLKALGYGRKTIMFKYIFYSGSAALIGSVVGFLFGTWFFPKVIWSAYGIMYDVSGLEYVFDGWMAVISLAASLLCCIGTTWLSCRYELGEVAAQLMRPKAPKAGKRVLLERIPFLWNRLKFLHKVTVRNIFRYKKRFFMMVIGISGCTALLVTGFGLKDSVTNVANQQFQEIHYYDINAGYTEVSAINETKELAQTLAPFSDGWIYAAEQAIDLEIKNGVKTVNMIILQDPENMDGFLSLHDKAGNNIAYPGEGEVVICRKLSEIYGLKTGDMITLREEDGTVLQVCISGVCENYIYSYIYLHADTYAKQAGVIPEFTSVFINLKEDADAHMASAALMGLEDISSVTVNADMMDRLNSMMGSIDYIVLVIVLCAAALAFIVLYNLTNINITERIREIATIKVLGFHRGETAAYVFRENTILSLIGAGAGLVLGYFMHQFVMSKVVVDMVSFDVYIKPVSYIYSFLLTLIFAWLINRIMTFKLERVNMAESLKSVD
ncbi:MAG: FtsX-like permease family protein [Lachnospiraceae bacterium]|nr:FtsX-like permease family protein [Lachnospiraceae bacterium]